MTEYRKLTPGEVHLLRLISKEQNNPDGWAKVSAHVTPLIEKLPSELVEFRREGNGGLATLTKQGESLLEGMKWI